MILRIYFMVFFYDLPREIHHDTLSTFVLLMVGAVAQWLEHRTGDRGVLGLNPAGATSLRNFDNSV